MEASLFAGLTAEQLSEVKRFFRRVQIWEAYDRILLEGDVGDELLVIEEGAALIKVGGREVGALDQGESVGEVGFVAGGSRTASVYAGPRGATTRLLSRQEFAVFGERQPQIALILSENVSRLLASKLRRANQTFREALGELADAEREQEKKRERQTQSLLQRVFGGFGA